MKLMKDMKGLGEVFYGNPLVSSCFHPLRVFLLKFPAPFGVTRVSFSDNLSDHGDWCLTRR